MRTINVGTQQFNKIINENTLYVDKTLFIKEWWENRDDVTLLTRPRRFGKTLTMNMMKEFFSVHHKDSQLFNDLNIFKYKEYRELQGTYPVISLSFASIKGDSYETVIELIKQKIINLYTQNIYLLDTLVDIQKEQFKRINYSMNESTIIQSIQQLSLYLEKYYNKKVIILLDEYDTPIVEAYNKGYYDKIIRFMQSLFNATFKDNENMYRAILTGITRVSKESLFSDFNNPTICGILNDKYSEYLGFTEQEVFNLLDEYGLGNQKEEVKYWYDGFTIGSQKSIYNPWSILNYLDLRVIDSYWTNTSSNSLVNNLFQHGSSSMKINLERLLNGETIKAEIDEQITFNELENNPNNIYSLLLVSGYFKIVSRDKDEYELDITNHEVRIMFEKMVKSWFNKDKDVKIVYNEFIKALFEQDVDYMNATMNQIMEETFSYFDTSEKSQYPEKFYHGFVLGMMMNLKNNYVITSNRESGYGRYDVMLYSKDMSKGYILEFKVVNHMRKETLETAVDKALKQIEEKKYETDLKARGIKNIYKYGFAFDKKKVLIKEKD